MTQQLRVIQGGPPGTPREPTDWQAAARNLRRIEKTLAMRRMQSIGPRAGRAMAMCAASVICLLGLSWGAGQLGLDYHDLPWKPIRMTIDLLPALVAVVVFIYFMRREDIPRTWGQQLDHDLARHEPFDRDAYRKLQQITAKLGYLDDDAVREWMWAEQDAIAVVSGGGKRKAEKSRFLSRDV